MHAAILFQSGPIDDIRVGEIGAPGAKPDRGLVEAHAVALDPSLVEVAATDSRGVKATSDDGRSTFFRSGTNRAYASDPPAAVRAA